MVLANKMEMKVTGGRLKKRAQINLADTFCPSPSFFLVHEYEGKGGDTMCDAKALNYILRMATWQEPP